MPDLVPDHLVLAARDLDAGAAWLEKHLGAGMSPGGKHLRMGTHNRLLGLGEGFYLELIAIDPQATPPGRPRWFDLDRDSRLDSDRPRLIHWAARSEDIVADAASCLFDPGDILPMERGDYRWRITGRLRSGFVSSRGSERPSSSSSNVWGVGTSSSLNASTRSSRKGSRGERAMGLGNSPLSRSL